MNRTVWLLSLSLALVPPLPGSSLAAVAIDDHVAPAAVMGEIGKIVREDFYDPEGLTEFNAAEVRMRIAAVSAEGLASASSDWLATLRASHTARFTPDSIDYYEIADVFSRGMRDDLRKLFPPDGEVTYEGVGIATTEVDGKIFISDVYDGSSAAAAGLHAGDEIVSVDDEPFQEIGSFVGKAGREVAIGVRRAAAGPASPVSVKVGRLQPSKVFNDAIRKSVRLVERDGARIGYLRIWSYASRGVDEAIMNLLNSEPLKSADGLVLDLRGRWGGAPADATDLFAGHSPTVVFTDRDGETSMEATSWQKPVVAIIDGGSRSGIEILAYGLKRVGVSLVGQKTAGNVLAGRAFMLKDNSLLELAVLDVSVDGVRLENNGVTPDIEVPYSLPYADGADPQFDRALDAMAALLRDRKDGPVPGG